MSLSPLIKQFSPLTRHQILSLRPGTWGDKDLMEAVKYFESEKKDRDRAMAVAELILCSPQMADLDYYTLFLDIIGYYRWKEDYSSALRWVYTLITFDEQHENGLNRDNHVRDLAEIYLEAGDLNTGLALFTRLAQASPGDIWNYNTLGLILPRVGLPRLAIEILDHALALTSQNDPEKLKVQLTKLRQKIEDTPDRSAEISPDVLADFRAGLLRPPPSKKKIPSKYIKSAPYQPPLTRMLKPDFSGDATLEAEILARGKVLIPELIRMAFDEELDTSGAPAYAIKLLRQLRDAQPAELSALSPWLDQANGDWCNEFLTRRFAKTGGYTTSELEIIVADVQADTTTRTLALEALSDRAKRLRTLRRRFTDFIRGMLTRPEADTAGEETIVGFLIGDALNLNLRELYPEITRAFLEDRVDTKVVTPLEVQHHWDLLPMPWPERRYDGMYLRLRCTSCNRIREHFVQDVLLELNTLAQPEDERSVAYDPYIMDHEIVCPKCGAVDRYAMTPMAHLTLVMLVSKLGDLTDLMAGRKSAADLPDNPRVHRLRSSVFGQPMHPLAGLEEYLRRIKANPLDAKLYMRMGTLLRTLYRNSAALEAHRQAYALNPNDAEIALVLGFNEHDFGDQSTAKKMYERVLALELKEKGIGGIASSHTYAGAAAEGLDLLKRHQPSAWALPAYEIETGKKTIVNPIAPMQSASSRKRHSRKGR
jgi:tetratricopeptide (TPR) repeat protein